MDTNTMQSSVAIARRLPGTLGDVLGVVKAGGVVADSGSLP